MWKEYLKDITPYKPGKPIEEVKRELGLERVIKLASNESPKGPSPEAIKAITDEASNVNRYPDGGCFYLREAIAQKLSIPEDRIVFGNGSDELIVMAIRACVKPGDEVVVADPTFLIYHIASMVEGATIRKVPLKDYRYDLEAMLKQINKKTKIVFIANPDNPTGSYVTSDELNSFIERVPRDVLIFIDEAYYEFGGGGDYPQTLNLVNRTDKNIVIARTFSKAYALAGLRVGYAVARTDIVDVINKVREPFNINSIAQVAAVAALKDEKYMAECVKLINTEKEKFYDFFKSLEIEYVPSKTNFILIDTKRDSIKIFEYLLKKGVIVREMSVWGFKGFIRVNIGLPEENEMFFNTFREALEELA